MADIGEEKKISGVFGGIEINNNENKNENIVNPVNPEPTVEAGVFGGVNVEKEDTKLPTKIGFWAKFKAFWLQEIDWNKEIKVELTPYQLGRKFMTFYFKTFHLEKRIKKKFNR